jgi:hypothetical protein
LSKGQAVFNVSLEIRGKQMERAVVRQHQRSLAEIVRSANCLQWTLWYESVAAAMVLSACTGSHSVDRDASVDGHVTDSCAIERERCNGADDDCDGATDEGEDAVGCAESFEDLDGDGFGAISRGLCLCEGTAAHLVRVSGDCDDGRSSAFPFALEVCNGVDDDCDRSLDEQGADGCRIFYADDDGDGVGGAREPACLCGSEGVFTATMTGDCDDGDANRAPARSELCDGSDNDCDGAIDEGLVRVGFVDLDGDGWGAGAPVEGCELVPSDGDCDDAGPNVFPGAPEACNLADDDCDGTVDDGLDGACAATDTDGDGIVNAEDNCALVANVDQVDLDTDRVGDACDVDVDGDGVSNSMDCEPADRRVWSGALEICDSLDNDCDGTPDDGFGVGASCTVGTGACRAEGTMQCTSDAVGTRCDAVPGPTAEEACNGGDDDCDGRVDEGEICPDTSVRNTLPYDRGVWYASTTHNCWGSTLLQVWPRLDLTSTYSDFDCQGWWAFRPSDDQIFFSPSLDFGIFEHVESGPDLHLDTPPCEPREYFGFDGADRLYYRCDSSLRRGAGELIYSDIGALALVLADGRTVVRRSPELLVVLDPDGRVLTTFDPYASYAGHLELLTTAGSVRGNDGFLAYRRILRGLPDELVVLRVDASSAISQVRRLPVGVWPTTGTPVPVIALPDGSVFVMERSASFPHMDSIRRYAPDGTNAVIWVERDATFQVEGRHQLLPGPLR